MLLLTDYETMIPTSLALFGCLTCLTKSGLQSIAHEQLDPVKTQGNELRKRYTHCWPSDDFSPHQDLDSLVKDPDRRETYTMPGFPNH